ncbi:MAG TPA: EAL domain-containing protein [Jatrophihabitans sp.]|jgi:EAL domain-containing protein (putative c-di-GMP-specific phosphodiesterase class I)
MHDVKLRSLRTGSGNDRALDFGAVEIVLQPIIDVSNGAVVAAEALARFPGRDAVSVEETFAVAYASGRGFELEAACIRAALKRRDEMPNNALLSVNVSPDALSHPSVRQALMGDLSGLIIEVTEHAATDQEGLRLGMADVRRRGARIAVDDASTGYAGLLRLTELRPDIVKLDRGLVSGVRDSVDRAAVIEALVSLSRRIGSRVLGEGVETIDDLTTLAELDVDYAQGYFVARPALALPATRSEAVTACQKARRSLMTTSAVRAPSANGLSGATAALAGSFRPEDLQIAVSSAAADLGVDQVALSTLHGGRFLREIAGTGGDRDERLYPIARYPATQYALDHGVMTEAHVADPRCDAAERDLLIRDGFESMLLTPVATSEGPLGVIEFLHHSHRRWTSHDLQQARTLAEHVANALQRMQSTHAQISLISAGAESVVGSKRLRRSARPH